MYFKKLFITIIAGLFLTSLVYAETSLHILGGEHIPFSSLNGKWVFINYWADWCKPCLDEIPELNGFYERYKDHNVAVFAVNFDALPMSRQVELVKTLNIRYPTLKRDPRSSLNLGGISGVPVTFVFNPQGELVNALYGGQTVNSLQSALAAN